MKLFMVLIGCKPNGRHTEQHDIYFGIGEEMKELLPQFEAFWPEAKGNMHVDGWKIISQVDGFAISISNKENLVRRTHQLFFINLGGYKQNEFDEFHYKVITVAESKAAAIEKAKQTAFYRHTGFEDAPSHIDDKYGIDVDDVYAIEEILSEEIKSKYSILIQPTTSKQEEELHLGYFKLDKL
jgi:hypothetical protein